MTRKECEAKIREASKAISDVLYNRVFEAKGYSEADIISCTLRIAYGLLHATLATDWWEDEER